MVYENLNIQLENGIAVVTISREKALNALNSPTILELQHFFGTEGRSIEGLKGVVITGAGEKAFVAGADISEFTSLNPQQGAALALRGQEVFSLIENFHVPVVAAVNGFALGGGCELAWHATCVWPAKKPGSDNRRSTSGSYPATAAPSGSYSM